MSPETTAAVVIAAAAALLLGMAGLIKAMIIGKLDAIQSELGDLTHDMHKIDTRVARIEERHKQEDNWSDQNRRVPLREGA